MRQAAAAHDVSGVAATITDDDVRRTALVGSSASVVSQLKAVLTPDVAKLTIRPLAFEGQAISVTVRRFIEQVWPRLAA
jgi:hypothetical protein